ncbi:MAG: VTC domain-containing protein [Blautia sp.]
MQNCQMTFERYEKKYLLSQEQYENLKLCTERRLIPDEYGKKTICNIYFDTPSARIIRASMEKPIYKEKLRLRSYGVPEQDSMVFVELKKKYKGVVYKRRETMGLEAAEEYLYRGRKPEKGSQVLREIDWFLNYYGEIRPNMYISYDRIALYDVEKPELRVTFDWNILWRDYQLKLQKGSWGNSILDENQYLMEIKIPGAMPVWLGKILDELELYPASFSKYGKAYEMQQTQKIRKNGGKYCA